MSSDIFRYAQVHKHGEAGRYLIARLQKPGLDWRSNFSPEVRRGLSPLMTRLIELTTVQAGEEQSFLTQAILSRFDEAIADPQTPKGVEFANVVFPALIYTFMEAVQPRDSFSISHEHMQEALVWMLSNAGSEGTGAVCNLTSRYLRTAWHNHRFPRQKREYDDIEDREFEKGHKILDESEENWHEEGFQRYGEFEQAITAGEDRAKLFVMVCLGRIFTRRVQASAKRAAEILVARPDFENILQEFPHILGPLNQIGLFYDSYGFLQIMREFVYELADDLGLRERVYSQDDN